MFEERFSECQSLSRQVLNSCSCFSLFENEMLSHCGPDLHLKAIFQIKITSRVPLMRMMKLAEKKRSQEFARVLKLIEMTLLYFGVAT
jgi:hypothetical protein